MLALLLVRLLTVHLGPDGYGRYIILITLVNITILIVDLGLNSLIYRAIALHPKDAGSIIGANLSLRLAISVPSVLAVIGMGLALYSHHDGLSPALYIAALDVPITMARNTVTCYYGARLRGEVSATLALVGKLLFFTTVAVYFLEHLEARSASHVLVAIFAFYVGADAITAVASSVLVHRRIRIRLSFRWSIWWGTLQSYPPESPPAHKQLVHLSGWTTPVSDVEHEAGCVLRIGIQCDRTGGFYQQHCG